MWDGLAVAGMTQVTAGWPRMYFRKYCAQLVAADLRGPGGERTAAEVAEQRAFLERLIDDDRDAARRGHGQQPRLGIARRNRIAELNEIDVGLALENAGEIGERAGGVMGDADIADAAGGLHLPERRQVRAASRGDYGSA